MRCSTQQGRRFGGFQHRVRDVGPLFSEPGVQPTLYAFFSDMGIGIGDVCQNRFLARFLPVAAVVLEYEYMFMLLPANVKGTFNLQENAPGSNALGTLSLPFGTCIHVR